MTTRPQNLATLRMALDLIQRIPQNRKVTAVELHRQLLAAGHIRDLRTVQRQLEMLSVHFDVERDDRNKPFGYRRRSLYSNAIEPDTGPTPPLTLAATNPRRKDVLHAVSDALGAGRWLELSYADPGAPSLPDKVGPLGLTQQGDDVLLVYSVLAPARVGCLALDRVVAARVTNIPFERPEGFRLQRLDAEAVADVDGMETINEWIQPGVCHQ